MRRTTLALPCLALLATGVVTHAPHASAAEPPSAVDAACKEFHPDLEGNGEVVTSTTYVVHGSYSVTDLQVAYGDMWCEAMLAEGSLADSVDAEVEYSHTLFGDLTAFGQDQGNVPKQQEVCANYTADNGDEVTCDLPADGEVFVSTVHAEEHDDGEFVGSDFTHIEWRFSLEGSDHTGEVRERTEAEVAEAAATRDEAVAAAKKAAAKKIKRAKQPDKRTKARKKAIKKAKKQRAREIRLAEKGYASAVAPYEVVEPITVLLENTREV